MTINKRWGLLGLSALALAWMASMPTQSQNNPQITDDTAIWDIYEKLGKIRLHVPKAIEGASAEKGRELVEKGVTTDLKGKRTSQQSAYYTCLACHNTGRESADLIKNDAQSRLDYSIKTKTPFLQGSTFHGIVNRESFYNDDYQIKYGSVPDINAAKKDLRKAIHVCATQCSQGRALEDWEMESVLLFFWELQLKISDLNLNEDEREKVSLSYADGTSAARAIHILEDKFPDKMPAHFLETPKFQPLTAEELKKPERIANGKAVYELSCMHCHAAKRFSFFALDTSRTTLKYLSGKLDGYGKHSVFNVARHGTYPIMGRKAYMPQYTVEKLSEEQLEDLRYYIQNGAKK